MPKQTSVKSLKNNDDSSKLSRRDWMERLGYSQRLRLRYFESKLIWEGQANRNSICQAFGVTPNHVTREIGDYKHYYPQNLEYDLSLRAYKPTPKFKPHFSSGDTTEYLSLLQLYAVNPKAAAISELGVPITAEVMPEPCGNLSRQTLQSMLRAIRSKEGLQIEYLSFSQPLHSQRIIWPHSFFWNGDRWHVRAYDSRRHRYIDIVPYRIVSVLGSGNRLPDSAGEDLDWIQHEQIEVIPNPKLPRAQQTVIAKEYGMREEGGQYSWKVEMRRCLVPYFLCRHRLDIDLPERRVELRDPEISRRFSFGAQKNKSNNESD